MTQTDKIENLTDYFYWVRQRPGMYIGTNTISKLYDHLQGYKMANWFNKVHNPIDENFFDNFLEFVCSHYSVVSNNSWSGVILEQCHNNEQSALVKFFELYDLFIEGRKPINSKAIVLSYLDDLIFRQKEMSEILGDSFNSVLSDSIDLIKENLITDLKEDYDYVLQELQEKTKQNAELEKILLQIENDVQ